MYTLIYRTGGTENWAWHKVLETFNTFEDAQARKEELERAGFPTLIHKTKLLNSIGLPERIEE